MIGAAGSKLSFVELESVIGIPGEQGEAWKCFSSDHQTLKFVAKLSRIPLETSETNEKYHSFLQQEFQTLAKLRHPNIVKVYHSGVYRIGEKDYPFYIMEYLGDSVKTLGSLIETETVARAKMICIRAFFDTADALRHLHLDNNGFHSDIKNSNILVAPQDNGEFTIKLIDFGFARFLGESEEDIDERLKAGRMAQKATSVPRPFDAQSPQHSDVWQLCCITKRNLDGLGSKASEAPSECWPFDYADSDQLNALLNEWGSTDWSSKPEKGKLEDFYAAIAKLRSRVDVSKVDPDLRGSLRYLAVPEIATVAKCKMAAHAIRIPPRRLVVYTDRVARLLATKEMTHLGNTRQLGFAHLVYPGAQGTRLEHSLGVYETACNLIVRLSAHPAFRFACPEPKDALLFTLAALLHDVGHFPFAHQIEEFTSNDFDANNLSKLTGFLEDAHERCTCDIIETQLSATLTNEFSLTANDIQRLVLLVRKKLSSAETKAVNRDPALSLLRSLVSGPIDIDKIDYIERDAYHCGVPYGSYIDVERILETMRIVRDDGRFCLAFDQRGVGCIEQAVTARHQLYANVYWHRAVRAATAMFKHLFYIFQEHATAEDLRKAFIEAGSDQRALFLVEDFVSHSLPDSAKRHAALHLARVVSGRERALYKAVVQRDHTDKLKDKYGTSSYIGQRKKAAQIFKMLEEKGFWDDCAKDFGEHNVLIDCRTDAWPEFDQIRIVNGAGKCVQLSSIAHTVHNLKESFITQACRIRVFLNVSALKPVYRDKVGRLEVEEAIISGIE